MRGGVQREVSNKTPISKSGINLRPEPTTWNNLGIPTFAGRYKQHSRRRARK